MLRILCVIINYNYFFDHNLTSNTMFSSHKSRHLWKVFALTKVGQLISQAHGETSSLLNGATVIMSTGESKFSAKEHLIDNSYKALVHSDGSIGPYKNYSFWFRINLGTSKSIKTVFIVNRTDCWIVKPAC